jgi:hypothetical protein
MLWKNRGQVEPNKVPARHLLTEAFHGGPGSADHAQSQATEQAPKDPQDMAREILSILLQVVAVLPATEVEAVLNDLPRMT